MPLSCSPACAWAALDVLESACAWVVEPWLLPEAWAVPVSPALACTEVVSCDAGILVAWALPTTHGSISAAMTAASGRRP